MVVVWWWWWNVIGAALCFLGGQVAHRPGNAEGAPELYIALGVAGPGCEPPRSSPLLLVSASCGPAGSSSVSLSVSVSVSVPVSVSTLVSV